MQQSKLGVAEVRFLFRSVIVSLVKGLTVIVAAAVFTLFVGSNAYAAPIHIAVPIAADPGLSAFIGCPTLGWVMPLAPTFKNLTGNIGGVVLLVVLLLLFVYGLRLAFAGRDQGKAQDSIRGMSNAASGTAFAFIAIPIIAVVIFGIASAVC